MVLLPRTKHSDAIRVAERARAAVESLRCDIGEIELHVTTSIGVVELRSGEIIAAFMKRADEALYAAKLAGRNGVWHEASPASQQLDQIMPKVAVPANVPEIAGVNANAGSVCHELA